MFDVEDGSAGAELHLNRLTIHHVHVACPVAVVVLAHEIVGRTGSDEVAPSDTSADVNRGAVGFRKEIFHNLPEHQRPNVLPAERVANVDTDLVAFEVASGNAGDGHELLRKRLGEVAGALFPEVHHFIFAEPIDATNCRDFARYVKVADFRVGMLFDFDVRFDAVSHGDFSLVD